MQFGTDPLVLTDEQRIQYIRQLQKTIVVWQRAYASAKGMNRDEMMAQMAQKYSVSVGSCTFQNYADDDTAKPASIPQEEPSPKKVVDFFVERDRLRKR